MKKQFFKKITLITLGGMLVISSCTKSPYPGYEKTEDGLYYKFFKHDEKGTKPQIGGVVHVIMSYKNSKDSLLFDSKDPKFNSGPEGVVFFPLMEPKFKGSLEEGLLMMSIGDSASFIVSADSLFKGGNLPPFIEKGSSLTFYVALKKFLNKEEVQKEQQKKMEEMKAMTEMRKNEEPKILAKYLEDNKIKAKPTEGGLYFIESVKGKGPNPKKGQIVKVIYTGKLIDGTIFDTSVESVAKAAGLYNEKRPYEPIEFTLGVGQVIKGWDEGIALMKAGSKAQFIIPSSLAYGEHGGGPIPPFSSLIFDVELVSFESAK